MSENPDKYGVFWYNEQEINHWSDADFEAKAAEFAAAGVNIVMTFSSTHFRWSFYPYWDRINAAIGKIVKACHKHNIRVVEHHSSHLQFNPQSAGDWDDLDVEMRIRHSSMTMFPELKENIAMFDPEIAPGVYLSSCRQIDGRTNGYCRTTYAGYGLCFNNPHYRKRYLEYIGSLCKLGVDGIMTDDVHFFGAGNSCTCQYCREKFKAETGYTLPMPDKWGAFAGNFDDPSYIAFLRFRMRSTAEFQRAVTEYTKNLGYDLLRPNYTTSTFTRNLTAYPFETASELWSCVFQENMFSAVIRQSYVPWSIDAMQRLAMAQRNKVMAMSMFYPDRFDNYYFSWALSRSWNHLLMATPEGGNINDVETEFLPFDLKHPVLENPEEFADMALLEPRSSLDYAQDPVESATRPFMVWSQAGLFRNLQMRIVFENDPPEVWQQYPFTAIAGATMLSDETLHKLKNYVLQGGRLFIFGKFAIWQNDGTPRQHPEEIFGIKADLNDLHAVKEGLFKWQGNEIKLPPVAESCSLSNISGAHRVIASSVDGEILGISCMNDQVIWLAGGVQSRHPEASQYVFVIPRWSREPDKRVTAPPLAAPRLYNVPGKILSVLLARPSLIKVSNRDYQSSLYYDRTQKRLFVHLVNTSGMLSEPPATVSHADEFINFKRNTAANNPAFTVTVTLPGKYVSPAAAQSFSPEFAGSKTLTISDDGGKYCISIPEKTFSGYLLIEADIASCR